MASESARLAAAPGAFAGQCFWYMVAVPRSTNAAAFIDRACLPLLNQPIELYPAGSGLYG